MAIIETQKTEILKIVAGLFNAAPGGSNLTELANLVSGGMTTSQLADALAANTLFTNGIMGGKVTVEDQAAVLAHNFGLAADPTDSASAGSQAVAYITQLINDGVGFGNIVVQAVTYLSGTPATEFTEAATLLDNKVLVSDAYSKATSASDLDTLQKVLSNVTGTAPYTDADVAAILKDSGTAGGKTFTLTNTTDAFTGTSGDDVFIGDNVSASAGDTLVGGTGTDTLKVYGTNTVPNISGIEQVYYNAPGGAIDLSAKSDVKSVEVDGFGSNTVTVGSDQAVKLTNQVAGTTATISGNTPTSLGLTLNKAGDKTGGNATVALTGTALTTLSVTASGNDSYVTLTNAGAKLATINVSGDKNVTIQETLTTVKTIDAHTATGNVTIGTAAVGASDLTFTGGKGNDKIVMGATVTGLDVLTGGDGTDTLSVSDADTVAAAAQVVGITGFEVFEAAAADGTTYNLAIIGAKNTISGLVISEGAGGTVTVSNLNAATTGNITINGDSSAVVLTAPDFVSGGTSDTTTISLDNSVVKNANGVDLTSLTFANADVINLKSLGDGSSTKTVGGAEANSITSLVATDAEKVVITGDEALLLTTAAGTKLTEIDASGMTNDAAVSINTNGSATASLLVKGTTKADTIQIDNAATVTSTIYTGGGSDTVTVDGAATSAHTLKFTATTLNSGDLKAGDSTVVNLTGVTAGATVTIDLSAALEGLLKSGGTLLSATSANINIYDGTTATSISATSNIAASQAGGNLDLKFDLNGDGVYSATDDAQIRLVGDGTNDTLVYNAAADTLIFTVV